MGPFQGQMCIEDELHLANSLTEPTIGLFEVVVVCENLFIGHPRGHKLEHVLDWVTLVSDRRLSVTDRRVDRNSSKDVVFHNAVIVTYRQRRGRRDAIFANHFDEFCDDQEKLLRSDVVIGDKSE